MEHVKGGWQGGRGWQVNGSAINNTDEVYFLAGKWMIENVFEASDPIAPPPLHPERVA